MGFPGVWILVGGRRVIDEKMLEQRKAGEEARSWSRVLGPVGS